MSKIGVLDSGLGGASLLNAMRQRYPQQDFIFLADQKNAPYGEKNKEELILIVKQNIEWLKKQGAEQILLACNTACSIQVADQIDFIPIQQIIEPTCRQTENRVYRQILVVATPLCIELQAYQTTLKALHSESEVVGVALPQLVPYIESMTDFKVIENYLSETLKGYQPDAVILGCTHYPCVKELFQRLFSSADIFDSNQIALLNTSQGQGEVRYCTTKDADELQKQMLSIFHCSICAEKIETKV